MRNAVRWIRSWLLVGAWGCAVGGFGAEPEAKVEMTVQLPPFIVDQATGPRWRYRQIPRFEILSRCNDLTTDQLTLAFHRANQLLCTVLPLRFQLALDAPQTLIFYDQKLWPAAEQAAVAAMLQERTAVRPVPIAPSAVRPGDFFLSNLMLSDADTITTFALVTEEAIDPAASYLTPAYVSNLLETRSPALPRWFTAGFMRLYGRMQFRGPTVTARPLRGEPGQELMPLATVLGGDAPPVTDPGPWLGQAELFVTWGLDPENRHTAAFWKFLELTDTETVTETLFRECFGFDYADAARELGAYALTPHSLRWTLPDEALRLPDAPLEDASGRQIARIKGEWERLEAHYVRKNQPDLESHYVALARRTLRKAYERDDRDPRLLASLGLLELEAGDKPAARTYLEAAVQGGVVRPRAYYELARLRYDPLVGRSKRNDGKFSREQIDPVLQPLLAATMQSPPLPAVYELMAHVSALDLEPPSPEVTAALRQGARLFPRKRDRLLELATKTPSGTN